MLHRLPAATLNWRDSACAFFLLGSPRLPLAPQNAPAAKFAVAKDRVDLTGAALDEPQSTPLQHFHEPCEWQGALANVIASTNSTGRGQRRFKSDPFCGGSFNT
jgi:hypothetical protein